MIDVYRMDRSGSSRLGLGSGFRCTVHSGKIPMFVGRIQSKCQLLLNSKLFSVSPGVTLYMSHEGPSVQCYCNNKYYDIIIIIIIIIIIRESFHCKQCISAETKIHLIIIKLYEYIIQD